VAIVLAAIVSSVLFGVYHFAHSPPFNTVGFVVLLTVIGLVTSLFYFVSRDVYGTIAFHNFAGILGVVRALESSGTLGSYERPLLALLVTAVVAVGLLVAAHVLWLPRTTARQPARVR
jgi:CAAX prenyl protease-like protein